MKNTYLKVYFRFLLLGVLVFNMILLSACTNEEKMIVFSEDEDSQSEADNNDGEADFSVDESENVLVNQPKTIVVHISGEVINPGVYELDMNSRLCDAVLAAGGFTEDADEDYDNLAKYLEDGCQYKILSKTETELLMENEENITDGEHTEKEKSHYNNDGILNINLATKEELMTLDGIGESKAAKIIDYRNENGSFKSIEDLKQISGIGNNIFSKISSYITVEGSTIK